MKCLLPTESIILIFSIITYIFQLFSNPSDSSFPETQLTINVLGGFVGIILYNHLDEVHALNNETFKGHSLSCRREHVGNSKLQGTLD